MNDTEKKVNRALEELKKAREELRVKMTLLGKDAGDVFKDAEDLVKFLEAKLSEVGGAAVKDAQAAVAMVRERLQKIGKEVDRRVAAKPKAIEPEAPAAKA